MDPDQEAFKNAPDKAIVRFVGLRRSGNHAIITWFLKQVTGPTLFLNNATPSADPFQTATDLVATPERGGAQRRLVISYEDAFHCDLERRPYQTDRKAFHGGFAGWLDALVLRDPYNGFASRIAKASGSTSSVEGLDRLIAMWKEHARLFLGERKLRRLGTFVTVSYNRWFTDAEYRAKLASDLGVDFATPDDVGSVYDFGGASSFDGKDFDGRAQEMAVLSRWQRYEDHAVMRHLLADAELRDLSDRAFGHIPGMA